MKKKYLLLLFVCVITLLASMIPTGFAFAESSGPVIECQSVSAAPGGTVDVTVLLKNNPGIAYLSVTPVCSSDISVVSVTNGTVFDSVTYTDNAVFVSPSNIVSDGTLFTARLSVASEVEKGIQQFSVIVRECYSVSGVQDIQKVTLNVTGAKVTVSLPAVIKNSNAVSMPGKTLEAAASELDALIQDEGNIEFYDKAGNLVTDNSSLLKTGMKIKKGTTEIFVAVSGDIDGDGAVSVADASDVLSAIHGKLTFADIELTALSELTGNTYSSKTFSVTVLDILYLLNAI